MSNCLSSVSLGKAEIYCRDRKKVPMYDLMFWVFVEMIIPPLAVTKHILNFEPWRFKYPPAQRCDFILERAFGVRMLDKVKLHFAAVDVAVQVHAH